MASKKSRLNWVWNDDKQEFATPSGNVVTLMEIATLLYNQVICHHDFAGPWMGWRMRGAILIPPHGSYRGPCLKPEHTLAFLRWVKKDTPQENERTLVEKLLREASVMAGSHSHQRNE